MKCAKCGKKFSLFYIPMDKFECSKCHAIVKCDRASYQKLLCLHFFIIFLVGFFFTKGNILTFIVLSIIISIPFFYKYIHMECRVVREGHIEEKELQKNDG